MFDKEQVEAYVNNSENQRRYIIEVLEEIHEKLEWSENEKILDMGCGPGINTVNVLRPKLPPTAEVLGVDVSADMVNFSKMHFEDPIKGLRFAVMDMSIDQRNDEIKGKFDKVFSFFCLHWIQNRTLPLDNVYWFLKPKGYAIFVFVTKSLVFKIYNQISQEKKWKKYMLDVERYTPYINDIDTPGFYRNALEDRGFTVIECYEKLVEEKLPMTITAFKGWLKPLNPFIERMPENLREEFMDHMINTGLETNWLRKRSANDSEKNNEELVYVEPYTFTNILCQKK